MKSNAPWSVKGIERDARETAKAAAQREGMTVGEWLNQIIYTAGDPDAAPTTGEIEGLKARDLAAAIEHLSKRIAIAESKSAAAVDNLARSLGGAVERLQRIERSEPASGSADEALAARIKLLEEKSTDRQRIEALRALERAVGQIAVQFSNSEKSTVSRLDATESLLQAITTRLESGSSGDMVSASAVRDAIEGMAERVARAEKIAAEAAQLKAEAGESVDTDFIHKTGLRLRILGDEIKRGGDQIRTLESTISRLAQQIDAAEKRSAEGVQKVAETIADLRSQFSNADASDQASARAEIEAAVSEITQRTEDRIELLQQSFDTMVRRLEAAGGRSREPQAEAAPQRPVAAAYNSEPAPKVSSSLIDDLDTELQDAFAALDLEEPVPTHAAVIAAAPEAVEADDFEDDGDDFGFDAEETDASASSETEDVLAEIREAFGIDAPIAEEVPESEDEEAPVEAEAEDEEVAELAPPPVAFAAGDASQAQARADYLKAARQAAREAAAKAAEEEAAPKKKLTPKQRAILAARIKRRKQEAEDAKAAEAAALTAPAVDRTSVEDAERADAKASVKARVAGLVAKLKLRPAPKIEEASSLDETEAATAPKAAAPNILAGVNALTAKLKKIPNAGGVLGLVGAIVLAGAAAFLMFKDTLGKKPVRPTARVEAPAADVYAPAANDRIAPSAEESPLVRPRELYLENIASLKSATTDGDARAALTHIEQAASLGHPPAQLQIGELYKLGQLYDRDLGQARMWFERAANGGNVLAMHRLGVMAARGEGGPVDPAASVSWFEKASSFGLVDSQYNLGATFHPTPEGAGAGIQDRAKAYFWYSIAAKNGDAQAGEMAAGLAGTMPAAERSAKDAEVAAWAPKTPDPAANELAPAE